MFLVTGFKVKSILNPNKLQIFHLFYMGTLMDLLSDQSDQKHPLRIHWFNAKLRNLPNVVSIGRSSFSPALLSFVFVCGGLLSLEAAADGCEFVFH